MGGKLSRKVDETAAAAQPAGESAIPCTQGAVETKNLEEVVGECVTELACKGVEAVAVYAGLKDAEPEPVKEEAQPNLPDSVSESSPPEPDPVAEPEPVVEPVAVAEPEPVAVAEPEPAAVAEALISLDPEPAAQEEPLSNPEAEVEAVLEPTSEPVPALEQPTDMIAESSPEPKPFSPPAVDLGVPDVSPQPDDTPPSPAPTPDPVDVPESKEGLDAPETCTFELEKSECLEEPAEGEATENLEQLVSHVAEENISGLLQKLDLKGNDLIPIDVQIPDDAPMTDINLSTDLI